MTTVAVTGASGKLGRHVVRDLHEHGYRVVALDRVPDPGSPAPSVGPGGVHRPRPGARGLHGGGRPTRRPWTPSCIWRRSRRPGLATNATTFANNITASYNVFAAARSAGIRNVVWASSETVLGLPFDTPPPYIPVDEEYPPRPESTYSLVKTLEEEMARHFCRWVPDLKMIALRFSNVMDPEDYAAFRRVRRRPGPAALEPVGLHRRAGRGAGRTPRAGARRGRVRRLRDRERRHGDVPAQRGAGHRGLPGRADQPRAVANTRRCCRSTRPAGYWATNRSTAGRRLTEPAASPLLLAASHRARANRPITQGMWSRGSSNVWSLLISAWVSGPYPRE